MTKKIVFITSNNDFFGQTRKAWNGMDSAKIHSRMTENGFEVDKMTHHEALNKHCDIEDSVVFYAFSQKTNIRYYLLDLIRFLDNGTNLIVPRYDLLKCHENKGYQELFKNKLGISGLMSFYFTGLDDLKHYDLEFPLVFKTLDGSNAKGVKLVKNQQELHKIVQEQTKITLFDKLDILRRRYLRSEKKYKEYPDYSNKKDLEDYIPYITQEKNFILQEFVPDLEFDFRVLTIGDKYYPMKRHTKDGDFRASGTKLFDFDFDIDGKLLDYASEIKSKMDCPFLSMDICFHNGKYHLFEFQALHFGVSAFMKAKYYFVNDGISWTKMNSIPDIENAIADGLTEYILSKNSGLSL